MRGPCPACGHVTRNLTKHINRTHGPEGPEGPEDGTGVFALAVVRRRSDGRFLMVQERYEVGGGRWVGEKRRGLLQRACNVLKKHVYVLLSYAFVPWMCSACTRVFLHVSYTKLIP